MIFPTETFILRGRDKRGDKIITDSQLIKIPKFLEGEKLPEGYFEAPDPYRVHKFPKCDLRKLTEYAGKIGKAITDMTKEEVTASGCGFEFLRQEQRFYHCRAISRSLRCFRSAFMWEVTKLLKKTSHRVNTERLRSTLCHAPQPFIIPCLILIHTIHITLS